MGTIARTQDVYSAAGGIGATKHGVCAFLILSFVRLISLALKGCRYENRNGRSANIWSMVILRVNGPFVSLGR